MDKPQLVDETASDKPQLVAGSVDSDNFRGIIHDGCPNPPGDSVVCPFAEEAETLSNESIWCPGCDLAWDVEGARETLTSVKTPGAIGRFSTSPKMEEFWATGDPTVFDGGVTDKPPTGY